MRTAKRRILATALLAAIVMFATKVNSATDVEPANRQENRKFVVLTVDYGDGAQKKYNAIPWQTDMTVLKVMQWADKHPHGIDFVSRGEGATAMLIQIDDLKNRGGESKNWIFRVNDKLADRSCGIFPVKEGDRILWRFERYQ